MIAVGFIPWSDWNGLPYTLKGKGMEDTSFFISFIFQFKLITFKGSAIIKMDIEWKSLNNPILECDVWSASGNLILNSAFASLNLK